jgi:PilZ domain-containing protein
MAEHEEKRDFVRMNIETQVTYTIQGGDTTHHGISGDLSATGLHMVTDYKPAENDIVSIVMNPSGDRLPPFVAEGKVMRVTPDENDANNYHVSIELTKTT